MAPMQWPWVTLKVILAAWNLSNSNISENIAHINYERLHVNNTAHIMAYNFNSVKARFRYANWFEVGRRPVQSWFDPVCDQLRTS